MENQNQMLPVMNSQQIESFFDAGRLAQMGKMAEAFAKSGAFGADVKNGFTALVKLQAGFEMGMAPMEAMNSLYIVNGHLSIYGMAMIKRLRRAGYKIEYKDEPKKCLVTVSKESTGERYEFTATEEMMVKSTAYKFAPMEKLRYHAIGRIIRFNIPEVLDGGVNYLKEEAEDFKPRSIVTVAEDNAKPTAEAIAEKIKGVKTITELNDILMDLDQVEGDQNLIMEAVKIKKEEFEKSKPQEQIQQNVEPEKESVGDKPSPTPEVQVATPTTEEEGVSLSGIKLESFDDVTSAYMALRAKGDIEDLRQEVQKRFGFGEITQTLLDHSESTAKLRITQIEGNQTQIV